MANRSVSSTGESSHMLPDDHDMRPEPTTQVRQRAQLERDLEREHWTRSSAPPWPLRPPLRRSQCASRVGGLPPPTDSVPRRLGRTSSASPGRGAPLLPSGRPAPGHPAAAGATSLPPSLRSHLVLAHRLCPLRACLRPSDLLFHPPLCPFATEDARGKAAQMAHATAAAAHKCRSAAAPA